MGVCDFANDCDVEFDEALKSAFVPGTEFQIVQEFLGAGPETADNLSAPNPRDEFFWCPPSKNKPALYPAEMATCTHNSCPTFAIAWTAGVDSSQSC
jgi:hypothetical protein